MTVTDDLNLLRQYATDGSQAAFTALVQRHINLVYSAAIRQIRSPHLAQEITQSVFTDLARNAAKLTMAPGGPPVTAWLYQVARRTAIDVIRQESRRQLREQIAVEMNAMNATAADWSHIQPLLDDAMAALAETDRTAILLRYFENKSLAEVGAALGTNDDAAQKRVSRAVDQLREFFSQRKVTIGASGLAVLISANAVQAAPAGLVATISTTALAGTAVAASAVAIAATKTIAMTTLQKTLIAAAIAVLVGTGIYQAQTASALRHQIQDLQQQQAPLADQIRQLQQERDNATNQLATLADENKKLGQNSAELLKLRGQVAGLQSEKNLNRKKAKMADAPAGANIISYAQDQERRQSTNAVNGRVRAAGTKLGLSPDKQQSMRDIMAANITARVAIDIKEGGGDLTHEDALAQYKALDDQEEQALAAVLTPDELTAYRQLNASQDAANRKSFANHEAGNMKKSLELTDDQTSQVASILADLPRGQGGPGFTDFTNAPQQLELRLTAFSTILTPDQLTAYRQQKLTDIQETLAQKQMAQQAYKSLTK